MIKNIGYNDNGQSLSNWTLNQLKMEIMKFLRFRRFILTIFLSADEFFSAPELYHISESLLRIQV